MKEFVAREFFYNGHLQSLGSVGIVVFSVIFFGLNLEGIILLLFSTYCLFQPIYYYDRYRDYKSDYLTNKTRSDHVKKYSKYIPYIILFLILIYLSINVSNAVYAAFVYGVFVMVAGLLYPLRAKKLTIIIPLFKNIYVASVHAILVLYPFLFYKLAINWNLGLLVVCIYVFIEAFLTQMILDTKDTEGDKMERLKTLAVLRGNKFVFKLAAVLSVMSFYFFGLLLGFNYFIVAVIIVNFTFIYLTSLKIKTGYLLAAGKFAIWILLILFG